MENVAELLDVAPEMMTSSLTTTVFSARGDAVNEGNSVEQSKMVAESLAKGLYSRLFDYVVQAINKMLSYSLQVRQNINSNST